MKVQTELRARAPHRADLRRQNLQDIRVLLENVAEAVFHDNRDLQVWQEALQELDGGRSKNAVAERPQADDSHAASLR